ncbi:MAG: DUF1501 domain-containing protein [SAR202 cluster bacterium]|jgi:uncharacterized protein (DUF1501 family)|nr:DUF1501 domain-containing protein [SAR202 cluster bacterium]
MVTKDKAPVIVVVQLTGGNDYFNTIIPYNDNNYYDNRRSLQVPQESMLTLDQEFAMHPAMGPMADIYKTGDMAIIHGIGYPNSTRSHFRAMDIWHTAEPDTVGTEGWLAKVIREIDPKGENPVTAVNIGQGLPRALAAPNVSVASVADVETYGLLTSVEEEDARNKMLTRFSNMYGAALGSGPVMDYLGQTGIDALKGADILKAAPEKYESNIEYSNSLIARNLRDVASIHKVGLGTRVFYTQQGSYDTHGAQAPAFSKLWTELAAAIQDFWDDLRQSGDDDNVVMFLFSEFGRRVRDNGSGTDHGAAGVSFVIGPGVKGGMYSRYPDTRSEALDQGDLVPNQDFRGVYSTLLENWLEVEAAPIVNGTFSSENFFVGAN